MSASVKFDNTEIVGTTYVPRFVKHESAPDRVIESLAPARADGQVVIAERYDKKIIRLQGIITGASQALMEAQIDTMKELFSRVEKNLDIDWNAGTRRYVASCSKHDFDRDHFHLLFCPWTAEFTVLSGEGKDTATTTALNEHSVTTTTPGTDTFTMIGTKGAKPTITLKGANFSTGSRGVQYKNTDTGEKIIIPHSIILGTESFIINCDTKKCYVDQAGLAEVPFYGTFPSFKVGINAVEISVGDITNQSSSETALSGSGPALLATNYKIAQSFSVPYTDATFRSVMLAVKKTGTGMGAITWSVQADVSGHPSGTPLTANSQGTIAYADVTNSMAYVKSNAVDYFTLTANTTYWLVVEAAATLDGSHYYTFEGQAGIYTKGIIKRTTDGGSTWVADLSGYQLAFKVLFCGNAATSTTKHSVVYTPTYL